MQPVEEASLNLTERSVSFAVEDQKKEVPALLGTTQGDHTTQPTVMTRYTNADMQMPSGQEQLSRNQRGSLAPTTGKSKSPKVGNIQEDRRASQPTRKQF